MDWGVGGERGRHQPVVAPALPSGSDRVASAPGVIAFLRRPLPLPSLISRHTSTVVYGLSALDDRGRVADRTIMRALGWSPGLRLDIDETAGVLTLRPDPGGEFQVGGGPGPGSRADVRRIHPSGERSCRRGDPPRVWVLLEPNCGALGHSTTRRTHTIGN
jgi:hypothetical protein